MWILFFLFCSIAQADVYVVTSTDKSVYSISEQDDAVVPQGYAKDVIKGKMIPDLTLGDDITLYDYSGKKFTLNDARVAAKNRVQQDAAIARQAAIDAKATATAKLKALGLTDVEIAALLK